MPKIRVVLLSLVAVFYFQLRHCATFFKNEFILICNALILNCKVSTKEKPPDDCSSDGLSPLS